MIRSAGQPSSQTGFDVESVGVYVDNREQLVRLFGRRKKMAYAAKIVVFLDCQLIGIGNSHGHASIGHEFQVRNSVIRVIDDGIENEIEKTDVSTDDRSDFGSVTSLIPMRSVEAEFEIDAVKDVAIRRVRGDEQGPQFESVV